MAMSRLRQLRSWLAAGCLLLAGAAGAEAPLLLVTSERGGSYAEAIDALLAELERGGIARSEVNLLNPAEFLAQPAAAPRLSIALGSAAAQALADSDSKAPQIYALLPRSALDRLLAARRPGRAISAVYLDQPFSRQLDLLRLALPENKNVAVLWGPASRALSPALGAAAAERGLRLAGGFVERSESLYPVLQQLLGDADVLLAVAEPSIYNSNSIQNILLASFRARVPLLAFSPAYVKAGALLAIYSTPAQIGTQAAGLARTVLQGRTLPAPQYPAQFTIQVNQHVARSLRVNIDESALILKLREMEHQP